MINWKKFVNVPLYLIILIVLVYFLEWYGVIGFFIFFLGMGIFRLIKNREAFMTNIKVLESMIWGKPLDKDQWEKGEMKNHKVKIIWRKNKDGKTN